MDIIESIRQFISQPAVMVLMVVIIIALAGNLALRIKRNLALLPQLKAKVAELKSQEAEIDVKLQKIQKEIPEKLAVLFKRADKR